MRVVTSIVLLLAAASLSCESNSRPSQDQERVHAAVVFNHLYSQTGLAQWKIHARAAGTGCSVLLVETSIIMEDAMVEGLHYGAGAYDAYRGGVEQFLHDRSFRGVVYRDSTKKSWMFGEITDPDVAAMTMCR